MGRCKCETEVYSRVVGYYRPVQQWNRGKQAEYKDRVPFKMKAGPDEKGTGDEIRDRQKILR